MDAFKENNLLEASNVERKKLKTYVPPEPEIAQ